MKALRHGWSNLMNESSPIVYRYGSSASAVFIAGFMLFAVTVFRIANKDS